MKSIQKKAVSVFLAFILLLGVLPAAFASEEMQPWEISKEELQPSYMQNAGVTEEVAVSVVSEENSNEQAEPETASREEEQAVLPKETEKEPESIEIRNEQEAVIPANGNPTGQIDEREKATIVLDLAMLTPEEWNDSDYMVFDEEYNLPAIELSALLEKIGWLIHEGKTKEWDPLEEIRTMDTPNDGSGYIFTEDFAENAIPEVQGKDEDKEEVLKAFIPYEGRIYILKELKECDEGQILYQDENAILLVVLKYDYAYTAAKIAAKEEAMMNGMAEEDTVDGMIKAGVAVYSEAGSFIADVPVKEGTLLSTARAEIDERTEQVLKETVMDKLGAENGEIYVAVYQATLADDEGNKPGVNAVVTMNTSIVLPENPDASAEGTVAQVKDVKVIQINEDYSLHVLDAEAEQDGNTITSVKFTASEFNFFAVCYTVNYLDMKSETQGLLAGPETGKEEDQQTKAEPLIAEGVTIEVMDGDMPEETEVVFQQLDSFSAKQLAEWAMSAVGK